MAWMQVIRTRSCVLSGPTAASARCSIAQVKLGVVIRAGRNAGLAALHAHGDIDVVMYLDDDGTLPDTHAAEHVCDLFATTPTLASSASASPSGPQSPSRAGPRPLGCVPGPTASSKAGAPRAARAAPSTGVLSGG